MIPVYNEVARVEAAIEAVHAVGLDAEIICVDDGSTDGTREILERLRDEKRIDTLVIQDRNRGKGYAIRTAIRHASADVLVIQDADLEYDPRDIPRLLEPIAQGRADAVIGSRFRGETVRVLYYWHSLGNHLLTLLSNILTNLNLTDMESGYKLMRADLAKSFPLTAERFGIEPELTARLSQSKARIYEVPINYSGRTYAEGKKIGWRDGVAALWHIIRFNLFPPKAPVYHRSR